MSGAWLRPSPSHLEVGSQGRGIEDGNHSIWATAADVGCIFKQENIWFWCVQVLSYHGWVKVPSLLHMDDRGYHLSSFL